MAARLFDTVVTSAALAVFALPSQLLLVDGVAAGGNVVVTLQPGSLVGQALGVELATSNDVNVVSIVGAGVPTYPLVAIGDSYLFTWDGAAWIPVVYDVTPGYFEAIAGATVGLYRCQSPTNFATDYGPNGFNLAAAGVVTASPGFTTTRGACKSTNAIGQQANAAFQLQGAMSALVFCNVRTSAAPGQNFVACGVAGAVATTNVQYALGSGAGGTWQYFHETGAGVDVVFAPASSSSIAPGWQVLGFTRSAPGVVRFYGNGVLIATSAALGPPTGGATAQLALGAYQGGTFGANADIAQTAIYSAELTAAQMRRQTQLVLGAHR